MFDGAKWLASEEETVFDYIPLVPIYGNFNLTVFNDEWKLVQEVDQDQLSTTVTNYLFRIQDDPNEYNKLLKPI